MSTHTQEVAHKKAKVPPGRWNHRKALDVPPDIWIGVGVRAALESKTRGQIMVDALATYVREFMPAEKARA